MSGNSIGSPNVSPGRRGPAPDADSRKHHDCRCRTGIGRLSGASAQEATPKASPESGAAEKTSYLFVQAFQSGSITPADGQKGRYTVTLEQGLGPNEAGQIGFPSPRDCGQPGSTLE